MSLLPPAACNPRTWSLAAASGGLVNAVGITITLGGLHAPGLVTIGGLVSADDITITLGDLWVADGDIFIDGVNAFSDRRLKDNVVPLSTSVQELSQLTGVRFTWNTSYPFARSHGKAQIGFIAQDVRSLFPELIDGDESTGHLRVNYGAFAPILLEGIKDLASALARQALELSDLNNAVVSRARSDEMEALGERLTAHATASEASLQQLSTRLDAAEGTAATVVHQSSAASAVAHEAVAAVDRIAAEALELEQRLFAKSSNSEAAAGAAETAAQLAEQRARAAEQQAVTAAWAAGEARDNAGTVAGFMARMEAAERHAQEAEAAADEAKQRAEAAEAAADEAKQRVEAAEATAAASVQRADATDARAIALKARVTALQEDVQELKSCWQRLQS